MERKANNLTRACDLLLESVNNRHAFTVPVCDVALALQKIFEAKKDSAVINAALLAACQRLTKNAECTCHDLGGMLCDVCEGKAAIAKALAASR